MRMRQQAIAMFECMDYAESDARTMFMVHAFVKHWTNPFRQCLKPLQEAHRLGMGSGDPRSAMYASLAYNECSLYAGVNLAAIDESMAKHIDQMKDFGQMHGLKQSCSARQAVRNLLGLNNMQHTTVLTGDVFDEVEALQEAEAAGEKQVPCYVHAHKLFLALYFGEHKHGAQLTLKWGDIVPEVLPGICLNPFVRFAGALSCLAMARKTGKRKYLIEGKRLHGIVKNWSEKNVVTNPNCRHHDLLLDAEMAVYRSNKRKAYKFYEISALVAGQRGFTQDQALASERFAEYCMEQGDIEEASRRFQEALDLYEKWGARRKVELLREKMLSFPCIARNFLEDETSKNAVGGLTLGALSS